MARVEDQGVISYQVSDTRQWLFSASGWNIFPKMIYPQEIQNVLSGEATDQNKAQVK